MGFEMNILDAVALRARCCWHCERDAVALRAKCCWYCERDPEGLRDALALRAKCCWHCERDALALRADAIGIASGCDWHCERMRLALRADAVGIARDRATLENSHSRVLCVWPMLSRAWVSRKTTDSCAEHELTCPLRITHAEQSMCRLPVEDYSC
jgi:hypothetical protein